MSPGTGQPRIIRIRGRSERDAALAAAGGRPLRFLSLPGAAARLGTPGWRALVGEEHWPGAILDCGAAPGYALDALRQGAGTLVLDPAVPAFAALDRLARQAGATLLPEAPRALDMARINLRNTRGLAYLRAALALPDGGELG